MEEELRERLSSKDIWGRALYMIFFAVAYSIAEFVVTFLVIFQFLAILFTRHANEPLLKLGRNLSTYIWQILQFQTFNTETHPFPFSAWPEEDIEDNRWLEDGSNEDAETDDPPESEVVVDEEPELIDEPDAESIGTPDAESIKDRSTD